MSGDDTEGTNSEERPLYTLIGKDQNEKIFPIAWAFMPSKAFWAYEWFFSIAVPALHPGDAIKCVQLILTDADNQETGAIEKLVGGNLKPSLAEVKLFKRAWHRWCAWHRINRNFTQDSKKYSSLLSRIKNSCILSKIEMEVLERWLWYFIKEYESDEELKLCMGLLQAYMNDDDQSTHIGEVKKEHRMDILEFVMKSFAARSHKLFGACFDTMDLGNTTTNASEGYHRGIKKAAEGVRPCDPMHIAAKKLVKMAESSSNDKSQKASSNANSVYAKKKDREDTVTEFSNFANDNISEQLRDCEERYLQHRVAENAFLVKRDYTKDDETNDMGIHVDKCNAFFNENEINSKKEEQLSKDDVKKLQQLQERMSGKGKSPTPEYKRMLTECMAYIIPRLERTRVVELIQLPDGTWVLVCSCLTFKKRGHACRHMYKVLKRSPNVNDAHIRWQNHYSEDYGRNDQLTNEYIKLRSIDLLGIALSSDDVNRIKSSMSVGCGEKDEDYFNRSHGKLCIRGRNTFWSKNGERFKHILGNTLVCVPVEEQPSSMEAPSTSSTRACSAHPPPQTTTVTTFGPTKMVQSNSLFVVPSQKTGNDVALPDDDNSLSKKFHPRYESLCKMAKSADGNEGLKVMEEHFHNCQLRFLNFIHGNNESNDHLLAQPESTKALGQANIYSRFLPPYKRICELADLTGKAGIEVASESIQKCHEALTALVAEKKKLSNSKKDRRMQKCTSPSKKQKR